eukprot:COSAG01_NODE_10033_length_2269_cov_2.484793_2_plen_81_part_00
MCFGRRALEALDPANGAVLWSTSTGSNAIEAPLALVAARASSTTIFGAGSSVLAVPDQSQAARISATPGLYVGTLSQYRH